MDISIAELIAEWAAVETWRPIEWAPNYKISSWGRVRGPRTDLLTSMDDGYPHVSVVTGTQIKTSRIHKLVALAFLGPPPFEGAQIAHNDGNKLNSRVDNIRWASAVENQADRLRHGTHICGSDVVGAKLVEEDLPLIRQRIASGERYRFIAADYGVSISTISLIKKNRTWRSTLEDAQ